MPLPDFAVVSLALAQQEVLGSSGAAETLPGVGLISPHAAAGSTQQHMAQ